MIRGVTFDWWHTIAESSLEFDGELRRVRLRRIRDALAPFGVRAEDGSLADAYDRQTEFLVASWRRLDDPSPEEQIRSFLRFAGLPSTDPELADAAARAFGGAIRDCPPILHRNVREVLERLRADGRAVGLVSNTGRTWGRYLRLLQDELGLGRFFDVRVFSDEIGRRKPDAAIFEAALRGLRLRPEEVVHVGDDLEADVAGAKGLGMRAVWFNPEPWDNPEAAVADAAIRDHAELVDLLEAWSR